MQITLPIVVTTVDFDILLNNQTLLNVSGFYHRNVYALGMIKDNKF